MSLCLRFGIESQKQGPGLLVEGRPKLAGHIDKPRLFSSPSPHPVIRWNISKGRVERLMRENGIRARHKRRYKATTDTRHELPVAPNLLDRQFEPSAPNQVWTSDITYLWTTEGWLYLAIVLDLFNREGWAGRYNRG